MAAAPLRWWMVLGIWALIVGLQLLIFARDIPALRMGDPDDVLRLVQVRDLLAGQGWFDLHQYRIMAPEGVLMHWSRLVDLPIAATIVALRPLLGTANAEIAAAVIVPALTVLCTLALAMHAANRLFGRDTAVAAGIIVGLSGIVLHQMQPLRIDHHGWQIVSALGAVVGLHARDPRRGGWVLGLALAAGLTVSLEGLPLTALFIGVVGLRAVIDGQWQRLGHAAAALALATAGLFLACRGLGDLVEHCDAVSPMHMAALGWVALCGAGLTQWRPSRRPSSRLLALAVLALAAGGAAAIVALAAPQCANGAFGGIDPYVKSHWLDNVREGRPIWETTLHNAIALIGAVPLGLWACWRLIQRALPAGAAALDAARPRSARRRGGWRHGQPGDGHGGGRRHPSGGLASAAMAPGGRGADQFRAPHGHQRADAAGGAADPAGRAGRDGLGQAGPSAGRSRPGHGQPARMRFPTWPGYAGGDAGHRYFRAGRYRPRYPAAHAPTRGGHRPSPRRCGDQRCHARLPGRSRCGARLCAQAPRHAGGGLHHGPGNAHLQPASAAWAGGRAAGRHATGLAAPVPTGQRRPRANPYRRLAGG
jgi:hypothetical protein